ncbi:hypothetical protein AB0937_38375 [Streptomyces sp. NPDC047880]|uniref:hypothetical protein n=1 Tax=Streptomyces TaxID=1883 RepID=UPI002E822144|nr:hypothetical protein [Streptomyces griseorubiginosus]WUB58827.1 hypothetical protein OG942_43425 [Streptomyces griseorubiginosus]
MRALIETFKTIRARHRAARRAGLRSYTVVLDWTAKEYAHYAPEVMHVRASSPLAAEMDALLQAAKAHVMHVDQFEGLEGRALLLEAGNQMKVVATFTGTHTAVHSDHF